MSKEAMILQDGPVSLSVGACGEYAVKVDDKVHYYYRMDSAVKATAKIISDNLVKSGELGDGSTVLTLFEWLKAYNSVLVKIKELG